MDRWTGKIAIVTGASAGIGEAIVRAFVEAGLEVVGLARRKDLLQKIADSLKGAKGKLHAIKCDLSNEEDILKAFEWTIENFGGVDVLVNNAAVAFKSTITDGITEHFQKTLDINVMGAVICTREALRSMKSRKTEGHLFFINSIMGWNATVTKPPSNLYATSKFALRALADTVKQEVERANQNVKTTSIIPGLVLSDFFSNGGFGNEIYDQLPHVKPKDIADGVMYALSTSPYVRVDEVKITPLFHKI